MLEFTSHIRGFKDILISVDLVPAVDIPVNIMPKLTNQLSCPSSIAEKGHLYVLLMKGNEKLHKTSQSVRGRFRVSTSFLEREIIKKFPAEIRNAYMLLKILNSNLVDIDYMSNQFFRTYIFKTALLHVASDAEALMQNNLSEGEIVTMVARKVLSAMESFWKDQSMPSYFYHENNLLEKFFKK